MLALALVGAQPAAAADLVVWHAYRGGEKDAFEKVIAAYNAANAAKGVKVSTLAVPYDAFADKITAAVAEQGARLVAATFSLPVPEPLRPLLAGRDGRKVVVGVRPENLLEVGKPARGATATVRFEVEIVEPLGHEVVVHARAGEDLIVAKLDPSFVPRMGDAVDLVVELDALHLFDPESELRLSAAGGDSR